MNQDKNNIFEDGIFDPNPDEDIDDTEDENSDDDSSDDIPYYFDEFDDLDQYDTGDEVES